MANYNVDIAVAIKNAEKLNKFNKQIKDVASNIKSANAFLEAFSKTAKLASGAFDGANGLVRNVDNLQKNLGLAKTNLKNVALGTKEATIAAYQFVKAQEQLNKGLQEELALIKEVEKGRRFTRFAKAGIRETPNAYSSPIGPGQASSVLGGQSVPVAGKIERTLALRRDEIRLQEALLALELKSAEAENQKLQIRGELNRQTAAAVNNARFIGQSSPLTSPVFPGYSGPIGPGQASGLFSGGAFRERLMSNLSASQASREASAFGIRPGTQYDRPIGPAFSAVMKSQLRHQKKIDKNTGKTAQLLSASNNRAVFGDPNQFATPIGPQPATPSFFNRMGFGRRANPQGPFANSRGRAGRISGSLSSGLIGGGFPLLFGQGGLAAAGGGIGGLAGGALGGGFGFGLSIAGTAIASRIQETIDFRKSIEDLNRSIAATGGQSRFTAGQVNEFAKSMKMTKEEALEALKAFEQFGAAARISLIKVFGNEATFNMLANLKDNASILNRMDEITKSLGFEQAGLVLQILDTQGARAAENKILELTVKKNKELNMQIKERVGAEGRLRKIRKEQRAEEELRVQQEINNARTILELQTRRLEQQERLAIIKAPIDEMEKLSDVLFQVDALGKSIGNSFSESFKGIVSGSMTAQQALRNLFQRTADHFLDMAAQMLAAQIRSGIFGIFKSFMGLGPLGNPLSRATNTSVAATGIPSGDLLLPGSFGISSIDRSMPNVRGSGMFGRRANGGPVMRGGSYLVGERGPEMFSPGVSGMVTPNNALGGTNVVVNVDASGSSVEGDAAESEQLGRAISDAIQLELVKQQRPGGLLYR